MKSTIKIDTQSPVTEVITRLKFNRSPLAVGASGTEVLELRKLLTHWDIPLQSFSERFDTSLEESVKSFQRRMFLPEDGVVGSQTWQALYMGAPRHMPTLSRGFSGQEVELLQAALQATGEVLSVDGVFGLLTEKAVRNFQRRKGLIVDGVVGISTWRALSKMPR